MYLLGQASLKDRQRLLDSELLQADGITDADAVRDALGLGPGFVGTDIHDAPAKNPPVDADEFGIADSADSWSLKKLTWANIKAALQSAFNDAWHGNRGGGALHAAATTSVAGFMSSADKTKLNGLGAPITSGTAQSTTSGTAKDFTGIPSGTTMIIVDFDEVSLDGGNNILVQLGDAGGFETAGYNSGSSINFPGGNSLQTSTSGLVIGVSSSGRVMTGLMVLTNITGNTWVASVVGQLEDGRSVDGGGRKALSATLDRVRITRAGTDNFDQGQVNIHYI